jgi:hypothetical protein
MRGRFYLDENIDVEMRIIATWKTARKIAPISGQGLLFWLRTKKRFLEKAVGVLRDGSSVYLPAGPAHWTDNFRIECHSRSGNPVPEPFLPHPSRLPGWLLHSRHGKGICTSITPACWVNH